MLIIRECEITEAREIVEKTRTHYSICVILNFQNSIFDYFERMRNFYQNYGFFPHYFLIIEPRTFGEEIKGVIFDVSIRAQNPTLEFVGNLDNYLKGNYFGVKKYLMVEQIPQDLEMLESWGFSTLSQEDVAEKMSMLF